MSRVKDKAFYESLSPDIRKLVRFLHECDYETTDSGDGTNLKEGMGCAVSFPMVVVNLSDIDDCGLVEEADHLWSLLEDKAKVLMGEMNSSGHHRTVEASYSPLDSQEILMVMHVTDSDMTWEPNLHACEES